MFVVLPITHEEMTSRRWPVVTIALIVLCLAVLVFTKTAEPAAERLAGSALDAAVEYFAGHRYLHPSEPIDDRVIAQLDAEEDAARRRAGILDATAPKEAAADAPPDADVLAEQTYLDALCATARDRLDELPSRRWGYVPARGDVATLFTYQFLHGGILHFAFNMWFLWLCGCNVEDRWGRAVYAGFYLSAGLVAALAHELFAPGSTVPLVGASGAIAGAMGAFLVCFATTRIRFGYFYWLLVRPRWGVFDARAYVMLPLWLAGEVFWGVAENVQAGGTAHWAHVGGFAYGLVFAGVLRKTGVDARLDAAVESKTVLSSQDPRLERAANLVIAGRAAEALPALDGLSREKPASIDVWLEVLRAAKALGDPRRESEAYARLVLLYLEGGMIPTAKDLLAEMQPAKREAWLAPEMRMRLAEALERARELDWAANVLATLDRDGLLDETSVRATVARARILVATGRREQARPLLEAARESPFATAEIDQQVDALLAQLPPPSADASGIEI